MKFTEFSITRVDDEIVLSDGESEIFVTADMADAICDELQKLKKEIKEEQTNV